MTMCLLHQHTHSQYKLSLYVNKYQIVIDFQIIENLLQNDALVFFYSSVNTQNELKRSVRFQFIKSLRCS
jgi:hypothetical protein